MLETILRSVHECMQACRVCTQQHKRGKFELCDGLCVFNSRSDLCTRRDIAMGCPCLHKGWERLSSDELVLRLLEQMSSQFGMSALSTKSWAMTAIDHHSMTENANCAKSTISTVTFACAAAVVVSFGL